MRVQNPVRLAEVLLAHDKGWGTDKVQEYVRRGGEIKLTTPIPVHITYFTAVVDDDGKLHYRPDVYGLDGRTPRRWRGGPCTWSPPRSTRASRRRQGRAHRRQEGAAQKKTTSSGSFNPFSIFSSN